MPGSTIWPAVPELAAAAPVGAPGWPPMGCGMAPLPRGIRLSITTRSPLRWAVIFNTSSSRSAVSSGLAPRSAPMRSMPWFSSGSSVAQLSRSRLVLGLPELPAATVTLTV